MPILRNKVEGTFLRSEQKKRIVMLNWMRRQPRKAKSSGRVHGYRPQVEGLEDRYLLSVAINAVAAQSVPDGKTLIVPVTATDSAGNPLTYTVGSSNSNISAQVLNGNTFLKISVSIGGKADGDMIFELFNDLAPNTVSEITALVNKGFYNGLTFHRVVPSFVIQGGDPNGNGTGGPGFTFDDEYNADLIYSGNGQLAMANSGPDTNGSQFFVTIGTQRGLDFDKTIFGQLVEGFNVRDDIAAVATDSNSKPITPVVMTSVSIIQDTTDAVLLLSASPSATSATITVTATAADGSDTKTFTTTGFTDNTTDPPFLNAIGNQTTTRNTPVTFTLSSTNIDNVSETFEAIVQGSPANGTATLGTPVTSNGITTVTVTPNAGFVGTLQVLVGVEQTGASSRGNDSQFVFDTQLITVTVTNADAPITAQGETLSANLNVNLNTTVATFTDGDSTLTAGNFTANINWGDGTSSAGNVIGVAAGQYAVAGNHTYASAGNFRATISIVHANPTGGVTASSATVTTTIDVINGVLQGNINYVQALYKDILGRAADTGGLNFWVGTLTSGQLDRRLVAYEIEHSPEGYTLDIEQTYHSILGRAADQGGLNDALNYLENGGNLQHLEAKLAGSLEFWTNKGQSMIGPYMNALYQVALGRNADSAGINGAIFLITKHFTLTDVAFTVYSSTEFDGILLNGFYSNILGRSADPSGQQAFMGEFKAGVDQLEIEAEILASDEFFHKVS
jgi:cyclophilin family peptidyl-prolyl cis-trans isomerase